MKLFPIEATQNGDNRYNDRMEIAFTESFRDTLRSFYSGYLHQIKAFQPEELNENDRISFDIFKREMEMQLEALSFNDLYIPFNRFFARTLDLGQMGSGQGNQPFKTPEDYRNWISRVGIFAAWADSAIVYFRKGMDSGVVLPKALVVKMIPQMKDLANPDTAKNVFYGPVKAIPDHIPSSEREKIKNNLVLILQTKVFPAYQKLAVFLQNEYLPKARTTIGISGIPKGKERYQYLIRYWTTTNKSADDIYNTCLAEVKRIRGEMERIKNEVGFKGDLNAFFQYMRTDPQFKPFKTPGQVIEAFYAIHKRMEPNLQKMFDRTPKTKF